MDRYKIDSFVLKFKNLLLAVIQVNLSIKSEAGKAVKNLSAEVDASIQPSHQFPHHHCDGIARQLVGQDVKQLVQRLRMQLMLKL